MGISNYNIIQLICDDKKGKDCWVETTIQLDEGENIEEIFSFVQLAGWSVDINCYDSEYKGEKKIVCPFCLKGLKQKDIQAKLKKGELFAKNP
jgi:hypothetical protein